LTRVFVRFPASSTKHHTSFPLLVLQSNCPIMSTAATVPASAPEAEQCPAEEAPKVVEADISAEPYAADAEVAEVSNDTLVLPTMAVAIVIGPWRISFQATDLCSLSTTHPRLTSFPSRPSTHLHRRTPHRRRPSSRRRPRPRRRRKSPPHPSPPRSVPPTPPTSPTRRW
jgi:hypothetical protein